MGEDKFKKRKKAQRRRAEKLRKWRSRKEKIIIKQENNPKLFSLPSSFG
jgi:hypothetical protein